MTASRAAPAAGTRCKWWQPDPRHFVCLVTGLAALVHVHRVFFQPDVDLIPPGHFAQAAGQAEITCSVCWPQAVPGAAARGQELCAASASPLAFDSITMNKLWEELTFAVTHPAQSSGSS